MTDIEILLAASEEKVLSAIRLVEASLNKLKPFDPRLNYTPEELEPYDALSDRFVRAVEISIKFFRTYERYKEVIPSETYRDLLNRMEKYGLINSTELWIEMRDVRNRIVHDYLPEQIKELYDLLLGRYGQELLNVKTEIQKLCIHPN